MGMSGLSPGRTEPTARLKPYKAARRRGCFGQRDPDALAKSLLLMGISSVSQGNVLLAPIDPPPSWLFWRRSIGWSTTIRVWRNVYPPSTSSPRFCWRWTILNATPMGRTT
jgi:hypothetical protein